MTKKLKSSRYAELKKRSEENPRISMPRTWASDKRIKIQVTQKHIDKAIPANSGHCMIADAIKDALPWAQRVAVDLQTIRFTDKRNGLRYEYLTPRSPQEALVDYDWGTVIKPFWFAMRAPRITQGVSQSKKLTPEQKTATINNLKKARLAPKTRQHEKTRQRVGVIGGKPSPLGMLAAGSGSGSPTKRRPNASYGTRREFGVRGLVRSLDRIERADIAELSNGE